MKITLSQSEAEKILVQYFAAWGARVDLVEIQSEVLTPQHKKMIGAVIAVLSNYNPTVAWYDTAHAIITKEYSGNAIEIVKQIRTVANIDLPAAKGIYLILKENGLV